MRLRIGGVTLSLPTNLTFKPKNSRLFWKRVLSIVFIVAFFFIALLLNLFGAYLNDMASYYMHPEYLKNPSPFSSTHCLWEHVKFASGQPPFPTNRALFKDRIAHTASCSPEVIKALVDSTKMKQTDDGIMDQLCDAEETDPFKCPLEWVIYATSCSKGLNRLVKLLHEKPDIKVTILGMGVGWRGWGQRIRAYHNYLTTVNPDSMVVLSDGEDVLLVPGCQGIDVINGFVKSGDGAAGGLSSILFEAVRYPWPDQEDGYKFKRADLVRRPKGVRDPRIEGRRKNGSPPGSPATPPSIFPYLNAGAMIGKAGHLQALIRRVYTDDCIDDQRAFIQSYLTPDVWWSSHVEAQSMVNESESAIQNAAEIEKREGTGSIAHLQALKRVEDVIKQKIRLESVTWGFNQTTLGEEDSGNGVPDYARPLIALDYDNDLFLSMYDVAASAIVLDSLSGRVEVKTTEENLVFCIKDEEAPVVEEISLSVEETNRLRISLGLKPLDSSRGTKGDQTAAANFAAEKEAAAEAGREEAADSGAAAQRGAREGADAAGGARARRRRRRRRRGARLGGGAQGGERAQRKGAGGEEGARAGGGGRGGGGAPIGDDKSDAEDELVSHALAANEAAARNEKNKKGFKYSAYDDSGKMLAKYDQDEDADAGFVLGEGGAVAAAASLEELETGRECGQQEEAAVAFLKPKKKKKKVKSRTKDEPDWPTASLENNTSSSRSNETNQNGGGVQMDVDEGNNNTFSKSNRDANIHDINFVDDDDLQIALSRARNLANKKVKRPNAQEILEAARAFENEQETSNRRMAAGSDSDDDDEEALVLSATSEFVNNLATAPIVHASSRRRVATHQDNDDDDDDDSEGENANAKPAISASAGSNAAENSDDDGDNGDHDKTEKDMADPGFMDATLALLGRQGFLEKVDDEQLEREKKQVERAKWLSQQRLQDRKREILKEREKAIQREINKAKGPARKGGGGGGGGSGLNAEDEWRIEEESRVAERQRMRELEERFKNYNPDVNIKYNDEYGRNLTQKEAFRLLSHKFHGKGSGKMKTEKRLLKMDEEAKLNKMKSADTPLQTASALLEKTKIAKTAHLVLAVGNRNSLPQDVVAAEEKALLEKRNARLAAVAKAKELKAAKAKGAGGSSSSSTKGNSSVAPGTSSTVASAGSRGKVAFGLSGGTKRKADASSGLFEESLAKKSK
ncbi:SART-1 family-domain-containing protein [Obelidium mucronatum]|nr:SART-1 family-domain-containing protein [Obelidium mucronatum]